MPSVPNDAETDWVRAALAQLNVDRLALILFDAACPRPSAEDPGVGTTYGAAGRRVLELACQLGFGAVQLGPQGAPSSDNPSPYDATVFSRSPLLLALDELLATRAEGGLELLTRADVERALERRPESAEQRCAHRFAFRAQRELLARAHENLRRRGRDAEAPRRDSPPSELAAQLAAFRSENESWLLADALYDVLCAAHGSGDFETWGATSRQPPELAALDAHLWRPAWPRADAGLGPGLLGAALEPASRERLAQLLARHEANVEHHAFVQLLLCRQHRALRRWASQRGLELYGDLAIGYSRRDIWHFRAAFIPAYRLGAPPSRTNPEGQPWGYPVLDPGLYADPAGGPGLAARLLAARAGKCFAEYDRVRIDHPHGLVCPWVYLAHTGDDLRAVQSGARLFSAPALPEHPGLVRYSRVRAEQLDPSLPRHADGYVRALDADQIERFASSFAILSECARGQNARMICEVLSTRPYELGCVLDRYGLGRFRVTQKADVTNPLDVYRTENAKPEDWVLLGNHDTPTIWQKIAEWSRSGELERQADYLAARLARDPAQRADHAARWRRDPAALAHAKLADLFVCDARNVMIAFTDLFGFTEQYNVPGTFAEHNWSQRLPRDCEAHYREAVRSGRALSLPVALRLALERCRPESALLESSIGRG